MYLEDPIGVQDLALELVPVVVAEMPRCLHGRQHGRVQIGRLSRTFEHLRGQFAARGVLQPVVVEIEVFRTREVAVGKIVLVLDVTEKKSRLPSEFRASAERSTTSVKR